MADRQTPTVSFPGDLLEQIDGQLDYGDSRAAWIRQACRERLEREDAGLDGVTSEQTAES